MNARGAPPTPFESLAAIDKFIALQKISPDFYSEHWNAVEFTCAFLRLLAGSSPSMEKALRAALPLPVRDGAQPIEAALRGGALPADKLDWFDSQMTEVLKVLVPVVKDPKLPEWLEETKWAILGAFE